MAVSIATSMSPSASISPRSRAVTQRAAQQLPAGDQAARAQLGDQVRQVGLLGQAGADQGHARALVGLAQVTQLGHEVGAQITA